MSWKNSCNVLIRLICGFTLIAEGNLSCNFVAKFLSMAFRNFKMVGYVVYGRGSFNQLDEIISPHRKESRPMIF